MDVQRQIVLVVTFLYNIIMGMMPLMMKWFRKKKNVFTVSHTKSSSMSSDFIISVGNYFCAGMLIAFLFLQLIPISFKNFNTLLLSLNSSNVNRHSNENNSNQFPYVEMIICASFFVSYFFKQLSLTFASQETISIKNLNKKNDYSSSSSSHSQIPSSVSEQNQASLLSLKKQEDNNVNNNVNHVPGCPFSTKEFKIPAKRKDNDNDFPSQPSSLIIVLPVNDDNDIIDLYTAMKRGILSTLSYFTQQIFNGFILSSQQGISLWILLIIFITISSLSVISLNKKLSSIHSRDPAIMFLCHLILSSGLSVGVIFPTLITGPFGHMLQSSISSGLLLYLIFMVLLRPSSNSQVKFRLLGYYLCVYSGFSLMLSLIFFVIPNT